MEPEGDVWLARSKIFNGVRLNILRARATNYANAKEARAAEVA